MSDYNKVGSNSLPSSDIEKRTLWNNALYSIYMLYIYTRIHIYVLITDNRQWRTMIA